MKNNLLKHFLLAFALIIVIIACKEKEPVAILPAQVLKGGKGGAFSIAVFSKENNKGKSSRIFLKYAADKHPGDTSLFEEKSNTMIEPGFGPHAHFNLLTAGTYYIYCAAANNLMADTVLVIADSTAKSQDIFLNLK